MIAVFWPSNQWRWLSALGNATRVTGQANKPVNCWSWAHQFPTRMSEHTLAKHAGTEFILNAKQLMNLVNSFAVYERKIEREKRGAIQLLTTANWMHINGQRWLQSNCQLTVTNNSLNTHTRSETNTRRYASCRYLATRLGVQHCAT